MRVLRGLYIWTTYVLAVPVMFVAFIAMFGIGLLRGVDVKEIMGAMAYGVRTGHRINMLFVNYGKDVYMDVDKLEEALE